MIEVVCIAFSSYYQAFNLCFFNWNNEKMQDAKLINSVGFEKNNFTPCIDESFSILLLLKHYLR